MRTRTLIIGGQGVGKTTLARLLANSVSRMMVIDGVSEIEDIVGYEEEEEEELRDENHTLYISNSITPEEAATLKGFTVIHLTKN